MAEKKEPGTMMHQTGVNKAGEPFVQLLLCQPGKPDQFIAQLSPQECRDHALAILEAAEAAEQDAFLVDFGRTEMKMSLEEAGAILLAFRAYREKTTGVKTGMKMVPPGHSGGEA
jgi:hypothetical protein